MTRIILQRVAVLVPTLFLASCVVFLLIHLAPGDPAIAIVGEHVSAEQLAEIRSRLGLDKPIARQYWNWLTDAIQGDLGTSLTTRERVAESIKRTFPATLTIVAGGIVVATAIGIPLGVAVARRANTAADAAIASASSAGVAMPSFWLGLIMVSFFSVRLGWLPATGYVSITTDPVEAIRHMVLPWIAIGVVGAAEITRQLRAVMIDVLATDHVRTLRAKGLSERRIVWRHCLKNSAVPLLTIIGLQISRFLGATVIIEAVFGISGLGTLVVTATRDKDFPVVQGVVLVMALVVILTSLLVDVAYRLIDPRIR